MHSKNAAIATPPLGSPGKLGDGSARRKNGHKTLELPFT